MKHTKMLSDKIHKACGGYKDKANGMTRHVTVNDSSTAEKSESRWNWEITKTSDEEKMGDRLGRK